MKAARYLVLLLLASCSTTYHAPQRPPRTLEEAQRRVQRMSTPDQHNRHYSPNPHR